MSPKLRVLVVDDERLSRETTTQQLREAGHEAEAVENAFQALKQLEEDRWDVVLTDLRMPTMDGLEFLKKVKQNSPDGRAMARLYGRNRIYFLRHAGGATWCPFSFGR